MRAATAAETNNGSFLRPISGLAPGEMTPSFFRTDEASADEWTRELFVFEALRETEIRSQTIVIFARHAMVYCIPPPPPSKHTRKLLNSHVYLARKHTASSQ